jgi:hypothetical protein
LTTETGTPTSCLFKSQLPKNPRAGHISSRAAKNVTGKLRTKLAGSITLESGLTRSVCFGDTLSWAGLQAGHSPPALISAGGPPEQVTQKRVL